MLQFFFDLSRWYGESNKNTDFTSRHDVELYFVTKD